jgi:hypothetical protein
MTFAVAALCGLCAGPARADTLPMFDGVPGSYSPGGSFTFNVTLPLVTDFSGYTLELVFTTNTVGAGLTASATPASPYPFGSTKNFTTSTDAPIDSTEFHLLLSDITGAGVVTSPGDTLATVTVQTDASLRGDITLEVGPATDFQHNLEIQYRTPDAITIGQGEPVPSSVPTPAGAVLLGVGGLVLAARRLVRR